MSKAINITNRASKYINIALVLLAILNMFISTMVIWFNDPITNSDIAIITLIFGCILFGILIYRDKIGWEKKQLDVWRQTNGYTILHSRKDISKKIKEYSEDANYDKVYFFGRLHDDVIANVLGRFDSVNIISTSYGPFKKTGKFLPFLESESTEEDEKFSNRFLRDKQICDIFSVGNGRNHKTILIFKKKVSENKWSYFGIEIKDNQFKFDPSFVEELNRSFSIFDSEQVNNINQTLEQIDKLWIPCKEGLFKYVLPPLSDDRVITAWREAILKDFNESAIDYIKNYNIQYLKITWNITTDSEEDESTLGKWLKLLKNESKKQNLIIKRYLLISSKCYKSNPDYKKIVQDISTQFDEEDEYKKEFYKVYYVDSDKINLNKDIVGDYAFLSDRLNCQGRNIVQDSVVQNITSEQKLLKTYFSRSKDLVNTIERRFDYLEVRFPEENVPKSLEEFVEEYI